MAKAKAVNEVHIKYFSEQQQAERTFLEASEERLCAPTFASSTVDEEIYGWG